MNWMRYRRLYFLISAFLLIPCILALFFWGLRPALDFVGGTLLEYRFASPPEAEEIASFLQKTDLPINSVQKAGDQTFLLRFKPLTGEQTDQLMEELTEEYQEKPEEVRSETVGPTLGRELLRKTVMAVVLAAGAILVYLAWRFADKKYGVCAVLAMFHDTIILLGSFAILGHFLKAEVDTLFVTAVLTTLSFSIHDTVVIYDRLREEQKQINAANFDQIANQAVTETIVRSVNNSLTIIFMLVALLFLGGETIRWFVTALLIGTIAGTYSSTFVAVPLLALWQKRRD